jgi:hypothetical protein
MVAFSHDGQFYVKGKFGDIYKRKPPHSRKGKRSAIMKVSFCNF